ncbi:MAG: helix-turn-helix transcriptional regulator [Faecousia sp.]
MTENNVKKCRKARELTLEQLSEKSGIPVSTINDIEHGAEPRVITAICLAQALGTTVEKLWPLQ